MADVNETSDDAEAPEKGKARRMVISQELAAMGDIESILDNLDGDEQRRVVTWLFDKWDAKELVTA